MSQLQCFARLNIHDGKLDEFKHLSAKFDAILQTCTGSGGICGIPSPELIEQLKGSSAVQIYKPFEPELKPT